MTFPSYYGPDYSNLPLLPAWYIPGFTSQNPDYPLAPPVDVYANLPFPSLNYVLVTGMEFDYDANPLGGYFTFMPSDSTTVQTTDTTTGLPVYNRLIQRYTGSDLFNFYGWNQTGSGKVYLYQGYLACLLLATDNTGLQTDRGGGLFYYVKEHFLLGQEYEITVPFNSVGPGPVDIRSLITSGPTGPTLENSDMPVTRLSTATTQNIIANLSSVTTIVTQINLSGYDVDFAFTTGFNQPAENDWLEGTWLTYAPPFIASILVGPLNNALSLPVGSYTIWVRVVTEGEVPVVNLGTLIIYQG